MNAITISGSPIIGFPAGSSNERPFPGGRPGDAQHRVGALPRGEWTRRMDKVQQDQVAAASRRRDAAAIVLTPGSPSFLTALSSSGRWHGGPNLVPPVVEHPRAGSSAKEKMNFWRAGSSNTHGDCVAAFRPSGNPLKNNGDHAQDGLGPYQKDPLDVFRLGGLVGCARATCSKGCRHVHPLTVGLSPA